MHTGQGSGTEHISSRVKQSLQCYTGRLLKRGSNDRDCNAVISLAKANDASRIILNVYSGYGQEVWEREREGVLSVKLREL